MEMWYTEEQTKNVRFSLRCDKQKYSVQSDFQRIEIFSTPEFGDVLVLDDRVMLTQKDEFIYHEMQQCLAVSLTFFIEFAVVLGLTVMMSSSSFEFYFSRIIGFILSFFKTPTAQETYNIPFMCVIPCP